MTEKAAEDLESYIGSRDAYNKKKMIDLVSGCVKLYMVFIKRLLREYYNAFKKQGRLSHMVKSVVE